MNKLIISEGGQPVYLEDLALLQNHTDTVVYAYNHASTGDANAYLLRQMNIVVVRSDSNGVWYQYDSGALVYNDNIYDYAAGEVYVPTGGTIYICPRVINEDVRPFEDGQSRACRAVHTAIVTSEKDGVLVSFDIDRLPIYTDLLGEAVGALSQEREAIFFFQNEYEGQFLYRKNALGTYIYSISIRTKSKEWTKIETNWKGEREVVIFGGLTSTNMGTLQGQYVSMVYNGINYRIRFGLSDNKVYLSSPDREDIPIVPWIRLRFTSDDLQYSGETLALTT